MYVYRILIAVYFGIIRVVALFSPKARLWVQGRKDIIHYIDKEIKGQSVVWFHCSSLGEFEQGRPLIEQLRRDYPNEKILLTFFSPSGYEAQKDYSVADYICYLPKDKLKDIRIFLTKVHPKMVIFVKYDYWFLLLSELAQRQIPTFFVSVVLKKGHFLTKWYGKPLRKVIQNVSHFYTQDDVTKKRFMDLGIHQVTVAGDTRVDSVIDLAEKVKKYPLVEQWIGHHKVFICGSTWPEGEKLLLNAFQKLIDKGWKIIIAPHDVRLSNIARLSTLIKQSSILFDVLESDKELDKGRRDAAQVLIVNTIGHLKSLYQYGHFCYVGGGFSSSGIHNTLEPAVFGLPIVMGPNYQGFMEAVYFAERGGAKIIQKEMSSSELDEVVLSFAEAQDREKAKTIVKEYFLKNSGATKKISKGIYRVLQ